MKIDFNNARMHSVLNYSAFNPDFRDLSDDIGTIPSFNDE